jgi:nicotinamide-nucleotide adenylyltransferase
MEDVSQKVVVYAGRFQPFHKGHYATYQHLVKKFGKDNVYIGTSNKTDNQKSPFGFSEKKYIMSRMFGIPANKIVLIKNPYAPVEILDKFTNDTTAFITAVGEKDEMRLGGKYFEKYSDGKKLDGYLDKGYVYISPSQPNPISGTDVRNWLGKGNDESRKAGFMKAYPKFDEKVFKLITLTLNKITKESLIETGLSGYGADEGEPAPMYIPDGQKRILNKQKPEPWFKQLGYTQMDKPKADSMRGRGKSKDTDSQFRKVYYKVSNVAQSDLNPVEKPKGPDAWKKIKEDVIAGGLAKGLTLNDIAEKHGVSVDMMVAEFKKGISVEMEHTTDREVAKEIALDHLFENPKYYTNLAKVEIVKSELDQVEKYADSQLSPEDIELGKETDHFFQRLNDPRNGKEISAPELTGFFKRLAKHKKRFIEFLNKYKEFVVLDKRTNINIPFMKVANKLIAKTIMRKPDFKSITPIFVSEGPTKGLYAGTIKIGGQPVKVEVELYGADNKTNSFLTKVIHIDSKYFKQLPIGSTLPIPARIFRTPGGGWYKIKSSAFENINESLLIEGGAYGHMNHPFDIQMNLTFADLKKIVKQALSGKLELAREKTDGQALAISWVNGRLVAARNKSHLKNKGKDAMSVQDVISKFAGRGSVSDAFSFAIKDLESAIKGLPETSKKKIFKDGRCFMNCEIIYPENTNVIPYGQSLLVFHGTMEYDIDGNPIGQNAETGNQLAAMVKKVNADVQSKFKLQGPPIQKLPVNKDLKAKQSIFLSKIQALQSEFGLTDKSGVADYHQAWWLNFINKNTKGLDEQHKIGLVKRWAFGDKGFRIKDIKDDKNKEWADKIEKQDQQKITKENLLKFETIFLGVGAEVLSFMTSVLTVNPDAAKQQMVGRLQTAIDSIKATGDAKNLDKLNIELARIEALGGFDKIVPNEGIVFNYKGNTFKLTGAFAPLNQILGIFTFSR